MSCFSSAKFAGSSPLTRGKPARFFAFHTPHGLIPAHAGKTACERVLGVHGRAHPRSRGENGGVSGDALEVEGSSPLTRGKLAPATCESANFGLIPAHAGKTHARVLARERDWAHPRSRGENG